MTEAQEVNEEDSNKLHYHNNSIYQVIDYLRNVLEVEFQ